MSKKVQFILLSEVLLIGLFAKCMSLVTKIIMTRELGLEAMSLFSLVNPLILLLLTLSSLSLQNAIGSSIARRPERRKTILLNALFITVVLSLILILLLAIFAYPISRYLLKNTATLPAVFAAVFVIPLTSVSSIIKGYFLGIGEMKLTSGSQVFEECGRLLFLIVILSFFGDADPSIKASVAVFSLCVGEVFQIVYMLLFYRNMSFGKVAAFLKNHDKKDDDYGSILKISIPLTLSRLVGSLTYFVEPIIFTALMSRKMLSVEEITIQYGILNSYVLPLLLMPGFISVTLSNLIIPHLGRLIRNQNDRAAKKYIFRVLLLCFFIGAAISSVYFFFSDPLTRLVYGQPYGSDLVRKYAFFFIVYYVESPIVTCLSLFNLSRCALISTIVSSIGRIVLMVLLIGPLGIDGLCIAIVASTYIDVAMNLFFLFRFFVRYQKNPVRL